MGLLGSSKKKVNEQLRTLSEKEIQDKLYGSYRSSSSTVRDDYSLKSLPPSKPAVSVNLPPVESRDLFKSTATISKPEPQQAPSVRSENGEKKQETRPKYTEPLSDEKRFRDRNQPEARPKTLTPKGPSIGDKVGDYLGQALRVLGNAVFSVLRLMIRSFAQVFVALDFRKAKVRTSAYWIGGIIVLASLLFSIHHLNIRREAAMKAPRKKVAASSFFGFKKKEIKAVPVVKIEEPALTPVAAEETSAVSLREADGALQMSDYKQGSHVIQVATFATEDDAKRLSSKIKESGMPSFVKPLTRSTGKVYYCVFIGRFTSAQDAEKRLEQFKKKEVSRSFQDAFVRSLD